MHRQRARSSANQAKTKKSKSNFERLEEEKMKTFCCFDSLLFYTIFIIIIVRCRSQQDDFNITNLPKEVRLSNYNMTEVSRGPSEISYQEVVVDNHQENTPNVQREMVELNPYGPFSRKYYKQSFFLSKKNIMINLNYF